MLSRDDWESIINNANLSVHEVALIVHMHRQVLEKEKALADACTQRDITANDRDNRRRRMDLAVAILDETQMHDLEALAEIVWLPRGSQHKPDSCWPERPLSIEPVTGDPTQRPTPRPGDTFVSWDCVVMGHKWGEVKTEDGKSWRSCIACNDCRFL